MYYRPEIDGLRAIAVGSVILYHAKINIFGEPVFKGGFIGVDIFFVISGYLITSIILKELVETNSFSFKSFYERRARRILPALLFVMLVSLPLAWMFLLPNAFMDFSKSILYSLGFSSNYYFNFSGQEYGADNGLFKPFLHTWSLSVEEQFYILFPISFFILFKYLRKYLIYILVFGFIVSLCLADWNSRLYPSISFYFIHTRAWELFAGSILAYFEIKLGHRSKNQTLNLLLPIVGMILIGHSILFFDENIFHPSFFTLLPILGVCLIIWFSAKEQLITKILSSKLFVGVGLISYSLYLWHFPIFAFSRITNFADTEILYKFYISISIVILSIISYFSIEKPFRNKNFSYKNFCKIIFIFTTVIIVFNSFSLYKNGKLNKFNVSLEKALASSIYKSECKFSVQSSNFLNEKIFKDNFIECRNKYKNFILIIGDSHSANLYNSIAKLSKKNEFIIGLNKGGCRPSNKNLDECHYNNVLKFIEKNNKYVKYILFTHKGSYFLSNTGGKEAHSTSKFRKLPLDLIQVNNTINYLKSVYKLNNNLVFVGPHLEPNISLSYFDLKKIKSFKDTTNYDLIEVDKTLKIISKKNNIPYLSKIDILDFKINKDLVVNGNFTFADSDHWSNFGEIYFGKKLIFNSMIKNILFP